MADKCWREMGRVQFQWRQVIGQTWVCWGPCGLFIPACWKRKEVGIHNAFLIFWLITYLYQFFKKPFLTLFLIAYTTRELLITYNILLSTCNASTRCCFPNCCIFVFIPLSQSVLAIEWCSSSINRFWISSYFGVSCTSRTHWTLFDGGKPRTGRCNNLLIIFLIYIWLYNCKYCSFCKVLYFLTDFTFCFPQLGLGHGWGPRGWFYNKWKFEAMLLTGK